jgi:hypothetical protein
MRFRAHHPKTWHFGIRESRSKESRFYFPQTHLPPKQITYYEVTLDLFLSFLLQTDLKILLIGETLPIPRRNSLISEGTEKNLNKQDLLNSP